MARPLGKCISLGGPTHIEFPETHAHPQDYLKKDSNGIEVNRDFIRNSGTNWVRMWTSWADVQDQGPFGSFEQTCAYINNNRAVWIRALDRQIRAANVDGIPVILVSPNFASWSNQYGSRNEIPPDRSTSSPWAWWIGYLMLRYTGAHNPTGPNPNNWQGNPESAAVSVLEIFNEPNGAYTINNTKNPDPVVHARDVACALTALILSANQNAEYWAQYFAIPSFGAPATDDTLARQPYVFTETLLANLQNANWRPVRPNWVWTHHNYQDIKNSQTVRAQTCINYLNSYPWNGVHKQFWLTEGGWDKNPFAYAPITTADEITQRDRCLLNFQSSQNQARVVLWTNHMLNDEGGSRHGWQTGFFHDWQNQPDPYRPGGTQGFLKWWGQTWRDLVP